MAKNRSNKAQLSFKEKNLTAYEASDALESLNAFLLDLQTAQKAVIDASTVENIDTAGCQLVDMAIMASRKNNVEVDIRLSEKTKQAFETLGLHDGVLIHPEQDEGA